MIYFGMGCMIDQWADFGPHMVDIRVIAHNLSQICRYAGATPKFYSVAEHCLIMSRNCQDGLAGLLHDAGEAYYGDVIRPVKDDVSCDIFDRVDKAIAQKFAVCCQQPEVKIRDYQLMRWEVEQFFCYGNDMPHCYSPEVAEKHFLERFACLQTK